LLVADTLGIPIVATSDCHYARKEDLWIEEAMLILSTNPKGSKDFDFSKSQKMDYLERYNYLYPDRTMSFEKFELFLHSCRGTH
jgi:DNA polymerase III alpha subunit